MKIIDILNNVDNESLALPVFQRGYVWKRRQGQGPDDITIPRVPHWFVANLDDPRGTSTSARQ